MINLAITEERFMGDVPEDIIIDDIWIAPNRMSKSMRRISDAALDKSLTDALKDARDEIERAFHLIAGKNGYSTGGIFERVDKSLHETDQAKKIEQWKEDQEHKYKQWAKACPRKYKAVVLDVVVFGFSVRESAKQRSIHHTTASMYLKNGLNEYCLLQGWGDQLFTKGRD